MNDRYKNILVICMGLIIVGLIIDRTVFTYIALGIGVVSLISLFVADKILALWFKIAMILGAINSKVLLSVIYFLVLLPLAMVNRLINTDPLRLKRPKVTSYFMDRNHQYKKVDLKKPW